MDAINILLVVWSQIVLIPILGAIFLGIRNERLAKERVIKIAFQSVRSRGHR